MRTFMIIYFLILPLFFIIFINPVFALTNIPNANTTDTFHYSSQSVDTKYQLNQTDSLSKMSLTFDSWKYSYSHDYIFKDNNNNSLVINFLYWEIQDNFLQHTINRNVSAYYNNIPLRIQKKAFFTKLEEGYEINDNAGTTNIFSNKDSLVTILDFSTTEIVIKSNIFSTLSIINNQKNTYVNLKNAHYISNIEIPQSDSSKYEFKQIDIDYRDNGISKLEYELSKDYNSLSFPFQFIFILFKGVLKLLNVLTLGYVVSDIDYYQYQAWFITPLSFLDSFIKYALLTIKFIWKMGLLWFISISSMIIFIYSYATSYDILDTFKNFAHYEYVFFNYVLIKPSIWIYEHLLIKVLQLLRG